MAALVAEPLLGWHSGGIGGLLIPFLIAATIKTLQGSSLAARHYRCRDGAADAGAAWCRRRGRHGARRTRSRRRRHDRQPCQRRIFSGWSRTPPDCGRCPGWRRSRPRDPAAGYYCRRGLGPAGFADLSPLRRSRRPSGQQIISEIARRDAVARPAVGYSAAINSIFEQRGIRPGDDSPLRVPPRSRNCRRVAGSSRQIWARRWFWPPVGIWPLAGAARAPRAR